MPLYEDALLLNGRSGGQIAIGGTGTGESLQFVATSHATKGYITLGSNNAIIYDETNERLGVNVVLPGVTLDVGGTVRTTTQLISTVASGTAPLAVTSTTAVTNLNADLLDSLHESAFAILAGRGTAQTLIGGQGSGQTLTLQSTSHATKGKVIFGAAGTTAYDEVNERFGIGTASPAVDFHVSKTSADCTLRAATTTSGDAILSLLNNGNQGWFFRASRSNNRIEIGQATDTTMIIHPGGGITLPATGSVEPTGGNKGIGTLNAKALYDDNALVADAFWDLFYDGQIKDEDKKNFADLKISDIEETEAFTKINRHLPSMPSRKEWEESEGKSLGEIVSALWLTVEQQAAHIFQLHAELLNLRSQLIA